MPCAQPQSLPMLITLGISCIVALLVTLHLTSRRRVYPFPLLPGPRPLPFLGNALQLDTERPWLTYTAWGKTYGKIFRSRILGIDMIIINSETIAHELLENRSANYSTRPVVRTNELIGMGFNSVMLPYGETLRQHRKIYHQVLRAEVSISYHEIYSRHANELVVDLLGATRDSLQQHTEAYSGSLIMTVTYGHLANEGSLLSRAHEILDIVKQTITPEKAAMFTAFPFLEKLPFWCFGGAFALIGRSRELCEQLLNEPFNEVKAQIADGTASHSSVTDFLSQAHDDTGEDMMKAVALTGYMAGMETTASVLQAFLLAMMLYPDVQSRARAEIDQAVGHDSMPCLDDRASLPYLDAILYEVLRWYPPAPLGVAHATSNDDVYDGHFIPKGAIVMVNQWALSRDEDIFPDASRFDPSRHLTVDGKLKGTVVTHFAFGHGRRICPGRWFADNGLWSAAAAILAVLRIDHAKDSNGDRIDVKPEFITGLVIHPEPFHFSFEVVNTTREAHIRAMMNSR
ncbi:cytochrome P450 [Suillus fuscotomentosus]|uniref:Cytochrome P450 n=1 Tax=Suillus fuscotomentosus TaxID=1912939 RepID=A0AAD4DXB1_9AGAM|nr:cytochrome P450 [Suillus fuscotomentosus]KAG1894589.1 cytochrome P450 [Suillus fuscotomentosus]